MDPVTGFYRDGCCSTGPEDLGSHTICAVVTAEFLGAPAQHRQRPVDAQAGVPLPGLVPGDRWCVTAVNWALAYTTGSRRRWCWRHQPGRAGDVPLAALQRTPWTSPPTRARWPPRAWINSDNSTISGRGPTRTGVSATAGRPAGRKE